MSLPTDDHNADLPEWLHPAGELKPSGETVPVPGWLPPAESVSAPGTPPIPGWLAERAGPTSPAASESPEPERPEPAPETPARRSGIDDIFGGASEDGLPAWMSALGSSEEPEAEADLPPWMADVSDESVDEEPDSQPGEEDVFDWMEELSADGEEPPAAPSEPAPPTEPGAEEVIPDWLSDLSAPEEAEAAPQSESHAEPGPASPVESEEVPEWLSDLSTPAAEAPAAPQAEDEPPAWIKELGTAGLSQSRLPSEREPEPEPEPVSEEPEEELSSDWLDELSRAAELRSQEVEPPAEAEDEGVPDWLDRAFAEPEEQEEAEAETPAETSEAMPGWMAGMGFEVEPSAEPEPPAEQEEDLPDWMQGFEGAQPLEEEQAPESEEPAELPGSVPDWMAAADVFDTGALKAEMVESEAEAAQDEMPDWLGGAAEPPDESAAAPPSEQTAAPGGDDYDLGWLDATNEAEEAAPAGTPPRADANLDDWLDSFDFDDALDLPEGETVAAAMEQEDLLGLTGGPLGTEDEEATPPEGEAEATAAEAGELPDWMRGLRGGEEKPPEVAQPTRPADESLVERLQGLRYTEITGREPDEEARGKETVGALKDVSGVIQPEIIFEGSKLAVEEPVEEVTISEEQVRQIALVKSLLAAEAQPPVLEGRKRALPVLRWVVVLVLVALAAAPLFTSLPGDLLLAPEGGPGVDAAYNLLDGLTSGPSTVVVAFEYEPDTAGELEPLAAALLTHLAEGADTTVYTISTRPTGPAMAENVLRLDAISGRVGEDGWVNLGYLPGRANGVHSLALGSPLSLSAPFAYNAAGLPSGIDTLNLAEGDIDLVVVLAARQEDLRMWVEQAGAQTDVPLMAAVSVRTVPAAQAYADGGQLAAVLAGVEDAAAYEQRLGAPDDGLMARRSVQAVAGGGAALFIVLGGIFYALWSLRQQQERTR